MDLKVSVTRKTIATILIVLFAFGAGFIAGTSGNPDKTSCIGEAITSSCLTSADLNRSDIGASIVLSRFCEGMGLQSSVIWQNDVDTGTEYGIPICQKLKG